MVRLEHKRGRFVLTLRETKLEWAIEPRYWRNPLLAVAGLLVVPFLLYGQADWLTLFTTATIYAAIAIPLAWQMGGIGRFNFGPHFFVGVGGFVAGLLNIHLGWGPWLTLPAVIIAGLAGGLLLSPLTTIAKGLYFSLITLILPLVFLELTYVFKNVFRGENGLGGIDGLVDLGRLRYNYLAGAYIALGLMLLFLLFVDKVMRSRMGFFFAAINDDEDVAATVGLDINRWKIITFTITSAMIAVCGWFFAHYFGAFAGVTYLQLSFMLKIILMVMIGGRGEIYGTIIGGYFIAILEKVLTSFALMLGWGAINNILFPLVLLIMLFALPEGLYGIYRTHKYREYFPRFHVRS